MHLPWYQIDDEAFTAGANLGRLLRVPAMQGVGICLALWRWAFQIAPEEDFSGAVPDIESIAAAVEWPIDDAPRLALELQRVGLIATVPDLRVRGLDRYEPTWRKNNRKGHGDDKQPESHTPPRAASGKTSKPERQTQTQTQTQTQNDTTDVFPAPRKQRASTGHKGNPEKPTDPRHAPLVKALCEVYLRKRGFAYPFDGGRDAKRVTHLLERKPGDRAAALWPIELAAAWETALDSTFPGCSTLEDFDRQLAKHLGSGPPAVRPTNQADPNTGIVMRTVSGECAICGGGASAQAGDPKQWFCYGACLEGANDYASHMSPETPWTVDLGPWVARRRAGAMIGTEVRHAS